MRHHNSQSREQIADRTEADRRIILNSVFTLFYEMESGKLNLFICETIVNANYDMYNISTQRYISLNWCKQNIMLYAWMFVCWCNNATDGASLVTYCTPFCTEQYIPLFIFCYWVLILCFTFKMKLLSVFHPFITSCI